MKAITWRNKNKKSKDAGRQIAGYGKWLTYCISQPAQQEESIQRRCKQSHEETKRNLKMKVAQECDEHIAGYEEQEESVQRKIQAVTWRNQNKLSKWKQFKNASEHISGYGE